MHIGTQKIVLLDGTRTEDTDLGPVLKLLLIELSKQYGDEIKTFTLRKMALEHCIGCFNCWIKTPGKCIYKDSGEEILQTILQSDIVVFFTPIIFGGYSSELKKVVDRLIPMLLPFFKNFQGETHHPFRYSRFPRLVGAGVHRHLPDNQLDHFKMLIGRNAANLHPPSYAVDVIDVTMPSEKNSTRLHSLINKNDLLPTSEKMISLMQDTLSVPARITTKNKKITLVIGSPKLNKPSTSAELGCSLMKKMQRYGWNTEKLTLNHDLVSEPEKLLDPIDKSEVILISFPLYSDALPFLVTKSFEVLAQQRKKCLYPSQPKYLMVIINSGFPEPHQSALALAICKNFAFQSNIIWAGGLAMGAGEALLSGNPITGFKGYGSIIRPPLYYLDNALNMTAKALSSGLPIPNRAVQAFARRPTRFISFNLWRYIYTKIVKKIAESEAAENGLPKQALHHRPYNYHNK
ncbi:MAG: flavodoxin family protein [Candidatus Electrothrix sp. LOE2]|nr:flavodoxin family protein [Candidatus Electrothrix sp. LOE2]